LQTLGPILGWGLYAFPAVLILISLLFFLSKEVKIPLSRILGLILMMVAGLAILHLSVPLDSIYTVAKEGKFGGYIGFVMNFLFIDTLGMGTIGASAIFLVLLIVGFLLTFEISLVKLIKFLKPEIHFVDVKRNQHDEKSQVQDEAFSRLGDKDEIDTEEILSKIDEINDHDLVRPNDVQPPLKIRRASIGKTTLVDVDGDGQPDFAIQVDNLRSEKNTIDKKGRRDIPIKNENDEALTSKDIESDWQWAAPTLDLLSPAVPDIALDDDLLADNAKKIQTKLDQFNIKVTMHDVHVGPTVVQYTLRPYEGIKLSKITSLKNDLALALSATSVRIEAPIPGKGLVGIEVPNEQRSAVHLKEILECKEYNDIKSNLRFPLGRDVAGKPIIGDLASMPHLLIAGATGSGKSVGMNTLILSLLYQNSPADLRLILVDPKRVELNTYNKLPHLLTPVITDSEKAAIALRWAVAEMNRRYQLFSEWGCRNIAEYNLLVAEKKVAITSYDEKKDIEEQVSDKIEKTVAEIEEEKLILLQKMPKIVIIIDELADLMMSSGKEVEASVCRVAQMARAVGMHLVLATQRPSVDVITGLIKANIPARIAFAVSSSVDSRTIIDSIGAEDLLGKGDMLYLPGGMNKPLRIQGIFVSSKEIEKVVTDVRMTSEPVEYEDIVSPKIASTKIQGLPKSSLAGDMVGDDLYEQALLVVLDNRKASASLLQRRLKVGYARAARLLDLMEENGAIGPVNGAKPREIYVE